MPAKKQSGKKGSGKKGSGKKGSNKGSNKNATNKQEAKVSTESKMDTTENKEEVKVEIKTEEQIDKKVEVECKEYDRALELEGSKPKEAITLYKQVINLPDPTGDLFKVKELSVYKVTTLFAQQNLHSDLRSLLVECRPFFVTISKARTAKIVRNVVEQVGREVKDSIQLQTDLCEDAIAWCKAEKRTFLKQRMQSRIAFLYFQQSRFKDALHLIKRLLRDVKKFDDKLLLVEIELIESKIHHALENFPKAKGALTAARSAANAVYCPPLLQAEIDTQSGVLSAEEKDFKTAFSYYYEAFEGYNTAGRPEEAVKCLKYMLLTKIMANHPEEVYGIVNGKAGIKYAGVEVSAMKSIADAYKKRSIQEFEDVSTKFRKQLADDPIVAAHLSELKNNLLEQNLIRIIEPYQRVQVSHIAKLIKMDQVYVDNKLSEMILDKKFAGILDQGSGDLIVFDDIAADKTYDASLVTVKGLGDVVDRLYTKAKLLSNTSTTSE